MEAVGAIRFDGCSRTSASPGYARVSRAARKEETSETHYPSSLDFVNTQERETCSSGHEFWIRRKRMEPFCKRALETEPRSSLNSVITATVELGGALMRYMAELCRMRRSLASKVQVKRIKITQNESLCKMAKCGGHLRNGWSRTEDWLLRTRRNMTTLQNGLCHLFVTLHGKLEGIALEGRGFPPPPNSKPTPSKERHRKGGNYRRNPITCECPPAVLSVVSPGVRVGAPLESNNSKLAKTRSQFRKLNAICLWKSITICSCNPNDNLCNGSIATTKTIASNAEYSP
ncbi:unnamed protein product [Nesidiocoris tenuis]|uniref:Uncharacterized protein n=1 Tax=Nesidiocoris tenuis TaxID=355587 RepID=A0A6H5FXB8_9HEMI|nr:unnamed protein product [Nesidiocoris tenuis]